MLYEANAIQDQRILDDDDVRVFSSRPVGEMKVVNPFVFIGEDDDQWQIQNARRLKRKLKRIMTQELSKKDVMSDDEAKRVSKVMTMAVKGNS